MFEYLQTACLAMLAIIGAFALIHKAVLLALYKFRGDAMDQTEAIITSTVFHELTTNKSVSDLKMGLVSTLDAPLLMAIRMRAEKRLDKK